MAFLGDNGRTEKATPKRRREARQKGQVARSPNFGSAVVLTGVFFLLSLQLPVIIHDLAAMLRRSLSDIGPRELTEEALQQLFLRCALDVGKAVAVITMAAIALGVGANAAQG